MNRSLLNFGGQNVFVGPFGNYGVFFGWDGFDAVQPLHTLIFISVEYYYTSVKWFVNGMAEDVMREVVIDGSVLKQISHWFINV